MNWFNWLICLKKISHVTKKKIVFFCFFLLKIESGQLEKPSKVSNCDLKFWNNGRLRHFTPPEAFNGFWLLFQTLTFSVSWTCQCKAIIFLTWRPQSLGNVWKKFRGCQLVDRAGIAKNVRRWLASQISASTILSWFSPQYGPVCLTGFDDFFTGYYHNLGHHVTKKSAPYLV